MIQCKLKEALCSRQRYCSDGMVLEHLEKRSSQSGAKNEKFEKNLDKLFKAMKVRFGKSS